MTILQKMVIRMAIPVFIFSLLFFVMILQMVDLFGNIWRYLSNDIPMLSILQVALLYLPKCISYALPIATLFAISFTLGTLYANNELIAVLGSGLPLFRFVIPLMIMGVLLSVGSFYFEENVVIDTFTEKNNLTEQLWNQRESFSNSNVIVYDTANRVIYQADYYNDSSQTLSGLTVIFFGEDHGFEKRYDARYARWEGESWMLFDVRQFVFGETFMEELKSASTSDERLIEGPETFRKNVFDIEEMHIEEARALIENLRRSGLDYREALTQYYNRFSFALTPFVVSIISCAIGSRFKKNILLMSLLISLSISVLYYVMQMVLIVLSNTGALPPFIGAWGALLIFVVIGFGLFRFVRT